MPTFESLSHDPLLSNQFFKFNDYFQPAAEGKISNQHLVDFLKFIANSVTQQEIEKLADVLSVGINDQFKQEAAIYLYERFLLEISFISDSRLENNRVVNVYQELSKKLRIDSIYATYQSRIASVTTASALVKYLSEKYEQESIISMTDRLINEGWFSLDPQNNNRLKSTKSNPNQLYQSELQTTNYAIYQHNLPLSWVKIAGEKKLILDLIRQEPGLVQLQKAFPSNTVKVLVNSLIQTPEELNLFFENVISFEKLKALHWLRSVELDLRQNLIAEASTSNKDSHHANVEDAFAVASDSDSFSDQGSDTDSASEIASLSNGSQEIEVGSDSDVDEVYQKGRDPKLLDFLTESNRNLLLKTEVRNRNYADPYFSDKFLDFEHYPRDRFNEAVEIDMKIKTILYPSYAQHQSPNYYENVNHLEGRALTNDLIDYINHNPSFIKEYTDSLHFIGHWLDENQIRGALHIINIGENGAIEEIINNDAQASQIIQNFVRRLFNNQHSRYFLQTAGPDSQALYIKGKKIFESLAIFLRDDRIDLETRKLLMISLVEDDSFGVCAAGCIEKVVKYTNELIKIIFQKPGLQDAIENFIDKQIDQILFQNSHETTESAIKDLAKLLGGEGMEVHAQAYLKKQLVDQLGMSFITKTEDPYVIALENRLRAGPSYNENLQTFKQIKEIVKDIIKSAKAMLGSKGVTLTNLIVFEWSKVAQLSDKETYNYFTNFASTLYSEENAENIFNEFLADFEMDTQLKVYLGDQNLDFIRENYPTLINEATIVAKYPAESTKDSFIKYFQTAAKPEELKPLHNDVYGMQLKRTGKLLFTQLYLDKLVREDWISLEWEKNSERLQNPASYFNARNEDWSDKSAFQPYTEHYHIYYSNLELSWIDVFGNGEKRFILDVLTEADGLEKLKNSLPAETLKEAINTLIQTPHELDVLFEKLPSLQFFKVAQWLCAGGLDLTNEFNHTPLPDSYLSLLGRIDSIKSLKEIISHVSVNNRRSILSLLFHDSSVLKQQLKLLLQKDINDINLFINENSLNTHRKKIQVAFEKLRSHLVEASSPRQALLGEKHQTSEVLYKWLEEAKNSLLQRFSTDKVEQQELIDGIKSDLRRLTQCSLSSDEFKLLKQQINANAEKIANFWDEREAKYREVEGGLASALDRQLQFLHTPAIEQNWPQKWLSDLNTLSHSLKDCAFDLVDEYTPRDTEKHALLRTSINGLIKDKILTDFQAVLFFDLVSPKENNEIRPSYLWGTDFSSCDLSNTVFLGKNDIREINFQRANLKNTLLFINLKTPDIRGFKKINFEGVEFSTHSFYEALRLSKQEFALYPVNDNEFEYDFTNTDVTQVDFQDPEIKKWLMALESNPAVPGADGLLLSSANAARVDFTGYNLVRIGINGANLNDAILRNVIIHNEDLTDTQLANVDMRGAKFSNIIFGEQDLSTVHLSGAVFRERNSLGTVKQLFDLYAHGIRDFSSVSPPFYIEENFSNDLLTQPLTGVTLSEDIFILLVRRGYKNFQGVFLKNISPENLKEFTAEVEGLKFDQDKLPDGFVYQDPSKPTQEIIEDEGPSMKRRRLESRVSRQKDYLELNKRLHKSQLSFHLKAVDQGLYFPSYEKGKLTSPPGECIAITHGFSVSLALGFEQVFLDKLKKVTLFSERWRLGEALSKREAETYVKFRQTLDSFSQGVAESSSLPRSLLLDTTLLTTQYPGLDILDILDTKIEGTDFFAHVIVGNHVIALYKKDGKYGYFDSNVAWLSSIKNLNDLRTIMSVAIASADYKVSTENLRIEVFNMPNAIQALGDISKSDLTTSWVTERDLLALQDRQEGAIQVNDQRIYRKTLYDMRAQILVNDKDLITQSIHSEMTAQQIALAIQANKISISAASYLEKLKGKSAVAIHEIGRAVAMISFSGTKREVKAADKFRSLLLSKESKQLNNYEWRQLLDSPQQGSLKMISFYSSVAKQRRLSSSPNFLTRIGSKMGMVSFMRGLHGTMHAGYAGDVQGFYLGSGEMFFSLLSDGIEKKIVKLTPKLIKQLKVGIYVSRGIAGIVSSPFDIIDIVQSSIVLAKAEKDSKEYRDAIANIVFAGSSMLGVMIHPVVGVVILVVQSGYMAISQVVELDGKHTLSHDQKARLFFHTLFLQPPPKDVQLRIAKDAHIEKLIERSSELINFMPGVAFYANGLGQTIESGKSENPIQTTSGYGFMELPKSYYNLSRYDKENPTIACGPRCATTNVYSLDESIRKGEYRYDCQLPLAFPEQDSEFHNNILLLADPTKLHSENLLKNKKALYNLREVYVGIITGSSQWNNEFHIYEGNVLVSGGSGEKNKNITNWFRLFDPSYKGEIYPGKNAANILDLSQLESVNAVTYDPEKEWVVIETQKNTTQAGERQLSKFKAISISHILGSDKIAETITCSKRKQVIADCKGNSRNTDYDIITDCGTVYVYGQTKVLGDGQAYVLYIKPSPGRAEINVSGGQLIFHSFLANASASYSSTKNQLVISVDSQSFVLTVSNYLDLKTRMPRFKLMDEYDNHIHPLISEELKGSSDTQIINSFNLGTSITSDSIANELWLDKRKELVEAEGNLEQHELRVFSLREEIRELMRSIEVAESEVVNEKKKLTQTSYHERKKVRDFKKKVDSSFYDEKKRDSRLWATLNAARLRLARAEKQLTNLNSALAKEKTKLAEANRKWNVAKETLKNAQQAEKKAAAYYETEKKIARLKNELERKLIDGVESSRFIKNDLIALVKTLKTLETTNPEYKDFLLSLIEQRDIEEAYLYYSTQKNTRDLTERYAKIVLNAYPNHSVFGTVKISQREETPKFALFGSMDADIVSINNNVTYAQGGNGGDLYLLETNGPRVLTINNEATDGQMDVLKFEKDTLTNVSSYTGGLLISLTGSQQFIYIPNYYTNPTNRHLAIMDSLGKTFLPHPVFERETCGDNITIPLIPFYLATKQNPVHKLPRSHWIEQTHLAMNVESDKLMGFRQQNDLILIGQNAQNASLMLSLQEFYPIKEDKNFFLSTYPDNSLINLNEFAVLAIFGEQAEQMFVEDQMQLHRVRFATEPAVISSRSMSSQKEHTLVLESQVKPDELVVNRTETDLVLSLRGQTIIFKDWDEANTTKIDSLWFEGVSRKLPIHSYRLDQTVALQRALNQLSTVSAIQHKIEEFNPWVVNALLYFLAVNAVANDVDAATTLGFNSPLELQDFMRLYQAALTEGLPFVQRLCTDKSLQEVVDALPWLIVRAFETAPDELVYKKVFSNLIDTSFNSYAYLQNLIFKKTPSSDLTFYGVIEIAWKQDYLSTREQKIYNLEHYLKRSWGIKKELASYLDCADVSLVEIIQEQPQAMLRVSSLEHPLVEAEVLQEKAPTTPRGWFKSVALSVVGGVAAASLATVGFVRYLRARPNAADPVAAAAVMIPLMQLSQYAKAQASGTTQGGVEGTNQAFFKSEAATNGRTLRIKDKQEAIFPSFKVSQYDVPLPENISLVKLGLSLFGRGSFVKRMNKAERINSSCTLSQDKHLPEDLYWAKRHLDEGVARWNKK